jgi:hypothetical protein
MNGKTDQKTGDVPYPSLFETLKVAAAFCFFNRAAVIHLFVNRRHTFNLISIFLIMYLLPVRMLNGEVSWFSFERLAEGVLTTIFFTCFIFLFGRKRPEYFMILVRAILAMELTSVVGSFSYFLSGEPLIVFMGAYIAWYLSLAVFAFSQLNMTDYFRSGVFVMLAFFLTQLMPALLSA